MKFVYSFWSKKVNPFFNEDIYSTESILPETFGLFQKTSVLLIRKYYPDIPVEIYTDEYGKKILEDCDIPFDNIYTVLDKYNNYEISAWPLVKLYAMLEDKSPKIHIDYDVFIQSNFLAKIKNFKTVYQCYEPFLGQDYYEYWMYKNKETVKKLRISEVCNAGFTFWNFSEYGYSIIEKAIEDYHKPDYSGSDLFLNSMVIEQAIIPTLLKRFYLGKFNTLFNIVNLRHNTEFGVFKHDIPELNYSHYVHSRKNEQGSIDYIKSLYKTLTNESW